MVHPVQIPGDNPPPLETIPPGDNLNTPLPKIPSDITPAPTRVLTLTDPQRGVMTLTLTDPWQRELSEN